jgi:hypothetical protein
MLKCKVLDGCVHAGDAVVAKGGTVMLADAEAKALAACKPPIVEINPTPHKESK